MLTIFLELYKPHLRDHSQHSFYDPDSKYEL